jgi:hypothetical protein
MGHTHPALVSRLFALKPLSNLHHFLICALLYVTTSGWLRSTTLTPYFWEEYNFSFTPRFLRSATRAQNKGWVCSPCGLFQISHTSLAITLAWLLLRSFAANTISSSNYKFTAANCWLYVGCDLMFIWVADTKLLFQITDLLLHSQSHWGLHVGSQTTFSCIWLNIFNT